MAMGSQWPLCREVPTGVMHGGQDVASSWNGVSALRLRRSKVYNQL